MCSAEFYYSCFLRLLRVLFEILDAQVVVQGRILDGQVFSHESTLDSSVPIIALESTIYHPDKGPKLWVNGGGLSVSSVGRTPSNLCGCGTQGHS